MVAPLADPGVAMTDIKQTAMDLLADGWVAANGGDFQRALDLYSEAQQWCDLYQDYFGSIQINPYLNLLRHMESSAEGIIQAPPPTEDSVVGLSFMDPWQEEPTAGGLKAPSVEVRAETIREYLHGASELASSYHARNIREELPHVMVLSTGRCGTISLFRLLERSHYLPYHQCFFSLSNIEIQAQACAWAEWAMPDGLSLDYRWLRTRAAEWLGAINAGRPAAFIGHRDTVFAPTFAALHPKARFIYLQRDPIDVFRSFYSKQQWSERQLKPCYYRFDGSEFRYRFQRPDVIREIAWYIRYTEEFANAFGQTLQAPQQLVGIDADALFAQERAECDLLQAALELEMSLDEIAAHFAVPYNQKLHKIDIADYALDKASDEFVRCYEEMR